ncbi:MULTISPECIES: HdeD family acid-resistance protein [unclassified Phenylobacterium]|uniref:HdeD family acid-resistance protein n=1 Tax=unclassified Phenylobacterium TaxID=2640670 RepID=UPI00083AA6AD|nr:MULTISPECIES: HdeD family acid-resistance protein [unclassified Phenylobacterium]
MTTADDISTAATERRVDALSALLARNWWAVGLRGVAAIVFGLVALFAPGATVLSLVIVFAALMLSDGVLNLIAGVRSARRRQRWGVLILQGVTSLIAAAVTILLPGLTMIAFVYLIAAWSIVSGGLAVVAAVRLRGDHGRWWMGLGGVLAIVAGVLLAITPLLGALVLTWWLGAYAIVFGVTLLVLAYRLRAQRSTNDPHHNATPHPA